MISIIIPAYNEEKTLYENIHKIMSYLESIDKEVIIVNDGSKDNTWNIIKKLSEEFREIKGIKLSRNFGKENAIFCGFTYSKGDAVIPMDSDLQDPPEYIPKMIEKWQEGYKVVECYGKRSSKRNLWYAVASGAFYKTMKKLTGLDLMHSRDFRLLDRKVVNEIINLKDRALFLKGMTKFVGFETTRIYIDIGKREGDTTKYTLKSLINLSIDAITSYSTKPLTWAVKLGILNFNISIVFFILLLLQKIKNISLAIFAVFLSSTMILLCLGIIGLYIGRIFNQVRERPRFIVDEFVK